MAEQMMTRDEVTEVLWTAWWCGRWSADERAWLNTFLAQTMIPGLAEALPVVTVEECIAFMRRAYEGKYRAETPADRTARDQFDAQRSSMM